MGATHLHVASAPSHTLAPLLLLLRRQTDAHLSRSTRGARVSGGADADADDEEQVNKRMCVWTVDRVILLLRHHRIVSRETWSFGRCAVSILRLLAVSENSSTRR
ncbi:Os01g0139100 [Oryza sativa Japonica Group]|nr:Os01g0139100 [Oryza sativa Japonica Group]